MFLIVQSLFAEPLSEPHLRLRFRLHSLSLAHALSLLPSARDFITSFSPPARFACRALLSPSLREGTFLLFFVPL